ncbi:MAG: hypothetical protein LBD30_08335 [Verrucomicrobiales bacterium]|jgi:predicted permease|nr:hypothetical protein [Verrucomicrobiales bacterium]
MASFNEFWRMCGGSVTLVILLLYGMELYYHRQPLRRWERVYVGVMRVLVPVALIMTLIALVKKLWLN